jgi:mycothiol synthase
MTDLHMEIRPVRIPDDLPALADLSCRTQDYQVTAEDLAHYEASRDPQYHHAGFVAEILDGAVKRVVGAADMGHDHRAHEDGKFRVSIMVDPDFEARGIGGALWQTVWNHLEPMEPKKLVNMTNSDSARGLRLLAHLGFQQVWERVESRLVPSAVDFGAYAELDASVGAQGIEIRSLESLNDPDAARKLYDLDMELLVDVPFGQTVTVPSFEQWHKETSGDPRWDPATIWIAVKDGEWLAMSSLERLPDFFVIGMTGVKRASRGLGLAKRLKLEGVRHALAHGGLEIRTYNDHVNLAMLQMNTGMGFQRFRSRLRFEKTL